MIYLQDAGAVASTKRIARALLLAPVALLMSACAGVGPGDMAKLNPSGGQSAGAAQKAAAGATAQTELQRATEYWGKKFAGSPRDAKIAVNYARNLKAMGEKRRALAVLQQAAVFNGTSRSLASEYGRLALDLGQVSLANKILGRAIDPTNPDWRVISARGAALAQLGRHKQALPFFERASVLAPGKASVQNNLAMAYTMDGRPEKAEKLLRKALGTATRSNQGRIRQNLSLVLGLQGKYDEARELGSQQLGQVAAKANVKAIRQLVKLKPVLTPEAEAERIVQLAMAAADDQAKAAAKAKRSAKRRKKRLALRRAKIKPAATNRAKKPAQVARSSGPIALRPSVHVAN